MIMNDVIIEDMVNVDGKPEENLRFFRINKNITR